MILPYTLVLAIDLHQPKIPLHFEPNQGQVAGETEWIAKAPAPRCTPFSVSWTTFTCDAASYLKGHEGQPYALRLFDSTGVDPSAGLLSASNFVAFDNVSLQITTSAPEPATIALANPLLIVGAAAVCVEASPHLVSVKLNLRRPADHLRLPRESSPWSFRTRGAIMIADWRPVVRMTFAASKVRTRFGDVEAPD